MTLSGIEPATFRLVGQYLNQLRHRDSYVKGKGKAVPLYVQKGSEGSRKLRFPDFVTTAQDGGRLTALRTGRLYAPGNIPGTYFC